MAFKMKPKKINFFQVGILLSAFLYINVSIASSPALPEKIQNGILLYNQLKIDEALPQLEKEAESGKTESQYYLGEALRKRNRYMTPEAQHWYEAAAKNGSIYAMIQLGRSSHDLCQTMKNCPPSQKTPAEWFSNAKDLTLPKANTGDPESLYLMYEITLDHEWLEKSANAGYPLAQYWMAVSERQGRGFFLIPGKREESVRNWLKLASEGGYSKAMNSYLEILYREGDMKSVRHWLEIAAETGDQEAVSNYGAYISHTPDKVGYPLDVVKGYAIFTLLKELNGNGGVEEYADQKIEEIAEKMTPEQIEQSKTVAQEWKATHPPLSFFPDKLSN